ncbi:hypothetical protein CK203_063907 [Vitis vinifera]|uniref:Uncharacterized protein n=1 Tax=Vitis vinifera TaxID=29760 RepID=A0A438FRA8_VITVI|nr:hypothetical protein CK203_063907 [Vitis vinifera]
MRVFTTTTSNVEIPKDIQEAMIVTKWKQVTLKEMRAPENKGRWQLVDALREHLKAVYHAIKYLQGSSRKGLMFRSNNSLQIEAYTKQIELTTSSYCSSVGGNLITLRSKK